MRHQLSQTLIIASLTFILLISLSPVSAQTASPPPTPANTPQPTQPPALLIITPTPQPPPGTASQQFWNDYRTEIIVGLASTASLLIGIFFSRIGEQLATGAGRLFHWLFDRFASTPFLRWRYEKHYRQALADSLLNLPGGELVDQQIRLDEMYVPALLTEETRPDVTPSTNDPYHTREEIRRAQEKQQVGSWEAIRRYHRFIVLGGPGAGKTTYLYHLAYLCAKQERPEVAGHLPIFIRFRELVRELDQLEKLEAIFPRVLANLAFPNSAPFIERQLKQGKCLILLDGLDEVPSEADHQRMIALVQAFAGRHMRTTQTQGRNILVVSSRKYSYKHNQQLRGFPKTEVMEFNRETIQRFVHKWFEGKVNHLANELMLALQGNRRFLELARNPLLLLLIAHHYERERDLPQQRADLYRHCVRTRITLWNSKRGTHGGRFGETQKWRLLRALALHLFEEVSEGLLWHTALLEWVEQFGKTINLPADTAPETLLDEVARTSGLVQEWAIDRYGFSHHTLQEFFTAEAIEKKGPEEGADLLTTHLTDSAWREVILLYAGLVDDAQPLLNRLLAQAGRAGPTDRELWLLAGQCLAEGAQNVSAQQQEGVARQMVGYLQANVLAQKERAEALANCIAFAQPWIPRLVEPLLQTQHPTDLFLATDLLADKATEAMQERIDKLVLPLAKAQDAGVQRRAIEVLGRYGVTEVAETALLESLRDPDAATRAEAALALGRQGQVDEGVLDALLRVWREDGVDVARHTALQALLALGQTEAVGMVVVPEGEFLMGSDNERNNEKPQHRVYLPTYYIDRTPVTNAQFGQFMVTGGYGVRAYWVEAEAAGWWKDGQFLDPYNDKKPTAEPRLWQDKTWNGTTQPVVGVSWYEALAYARWAGKRLPTEAEWEKAARGTDGRRYSWGNDWQANHANTKEVGHGKTTPVGQYSPAGDSPYGAVDMVGNVWEWCSTRWHNEQKVGYTYPYTPDDGREDLSGNKDILRVQRGSSYYHDKDISRCAFRDGDYPVIRNNDYGFRCCATSSLGSGF